MTRADPTLHGSAPESSRVVLLLVDVINDMEFPQGRRLQRNAEPAARRIAALKRRAKALGIPVIYVNDNFGRWQSDFKRLVRHCLDDGVRGEAVARLLAPDEDDYFVLKPKHSGFFATPLRILLQYMGADTVILTGFASNLCILYTANDAYMHDFRLFVPRDCIAAEQKALHEHAVAHMERCLQADVRTAARIPLRTLLRSGPARKGPPSAGPPRRGAG